MAELEKMSRTAKKVIPDAPHEVLLVLDATTGQNGLEQARKFTETSGVTGIVLTKLDGTAKGGIVVAIARELNLPIRYIGRGREGGRPAAVRLRKVHRIALRKMNPAFMREALDLARQGRALASPNPMVGAVLVRDGEVVGRGFHTYAGVQPRRSHRAGGGRRAGARRHALSQPGALLAPGPHAALRRCADRRRAWRAWWRPCEDPNPLVAGRGLPQAARGRHRSGDGRRVRRRSREAQRAVPPLHAHRPAAGDAQDRHHAGRQDLRAGRQSRLDHQRARPRPRAGAAPRSRRHPHRHRHRAGRRLPADRPHRPAALPAAAAHRAWIRSCACRSIRRWCAAPPAMCWWSPPRAASAERRKAAGSARRRRCWSSTARAAAPTCAASSSGWAAQRYLSLMIEAGSKVNWTALETGVRGPHLLLLRPQDSGRPGGAAAGRRHRAAAPRRRHPRSTTSPSIPFRPTNSPWKDTWMFTGIIEELGTVESVEPRAAGARLKVRCATVLRGPDRRRQHRGERRVPHRRGPAARFVLRRPRARRRCGAATWAICAPARA